MVGINIDRQEHESLSVNDYALHQPLVSVIIPVYNRVEQLEAALQSVLSQKDGIAELIVIDGGSTDGTVDVIRKYIDRLAYWVSETDNGIYDAMNKGVKHARGKYLLFLGSDDRLIVRLDEIRGDLRDPSTIYYGNYRTEAGPAWDGPYTSWRLAVQTINHQSVFYPVKAFEDGGYSTKYKISGDWEFNLRCFANKKLRFQYIPCEISFFSREGVSSQFGDDVFRGDRLSLIRQHLPFHAFLYASLRSFMGRCVKRQSR